jgi:hypothetical protein
MLQKSSSLYSGFVPDLHMTPQAFSSSFTTALLLAGTAPAAEAAVLSSIEQLNCGDNLPDTLLRGSVIAALAAQPVVDRGQASGLLPEALGRVLRLARVQRQCYVLRILLGWPSEECARFVAMDSGRVDDHACEAAQALALMVPIETAGPYIRETLQSTLSSARTPTS